LVISTVTGAISGMRSLSCNRHRHWIWCYIQCGDAQPIRNEDDPGYMHCPKKYRELGDFWMFHDGVEKFPVPLLFIGGNHEPWNYLDENREGGLLADNIEFLGRVGMRIINGTRIVGLSGVHSPKYFNTPHIDWPYPISRKKQATYYNSEDLDKALSFGEADILLLHEWPSLMNEAKDKNWPPQWGNVGSEHLDSAYGVTRSQTHILCSHACPGPIREGQHRDCVPF
jgi:lariat debranching enzyme